MYDLVQDIATYRRLHRMQLAGDRLDTEARLRLAALQDLLIEPSLAAPDGKACRRRFRRTLGRLPALVLRIGGDRALSATVLSLGADGAMVRCEVPLLPDERILLTVYDTQRERSLRFAAQVRWTRMHDEGQVAGLMFLDEDAPIATADSIFGAPERLADEKPERDHDALRRAVRAA